jgi:hypothetical protein
VTNVCSCTYCCSAACSRACPLSQHCSNSGEPSCNW